MTNNNKKIIREAVDLCANEIKDILKPIPGHLDRNPWAHIYREIKSQMGKSYTDCDDSDILVILEIIKQVSKSCC